MSVKIFENKRWLAGDQKVVNRHKAALEMIDRGKALDLGCGDGLFMEMLKNRGINCVGIDISEEAIKKCRAKGLDARLFNLEEGPLPYADKEFDYAVILDNLEHLYFPQNLLSEAARVSKCVVASIPNFNSLPARLQTLIGRVPENNRANKGHVFWFNHEIFTAMIASCGLEIVDHRYNTVWENRLFFGPAIRFCLRLWPSLFALTFIVKLENKK